MKSLDLRDSKLSNLYLGHTPHLETLELGGCNDLVEVHMLVECPKLKFLNIGRSKLNNLYLGLTPHLETLYLGGCEELVELHMPVECPKLKILNLSGSKDVLPGFDSLATLELIAESFDICPLHPNNNLPKLQFKVSYFEPVFSLSGNLEKLISFGLCACTNLEIFSASICGLQCLGKLTLEGSIPEVPKDLYRLENLERLTLSIKEIKHLPDSIFEKLPEELGCLECLKELNIEGAGISRLPQSIFQLKGICIVGSKWRLESYSQYEPPLLIVVKE
ncbi:hypothetical protein L1987_01317 [Smallanthus sonchifolius]|uniref:Uncharacterized protein n=1 Tax=Smallanthus sonchifolius TaxID=185202 RepID=A0ACB9K4W2_9ASTR|nr:hypothetical protein L1987_01317 [Smallanthus sonchifolius]